MLHDTQRTSAPSSSSVSISTAVCTVMCSEPITRAPASGLAGVAFAHGHQPGHLLLGEPDFLAAPLGEPEVRDLERRRARLAGLIEGMFSGYSGRHVLLRPEKA